MKYVVPILLIEAPSAKNAAVMYRKCIRRIRAPSIHEGAKGGGHVTMFLPVITPLPITKTQLSHLKVSEKWFHDLNSQNKFSRHNIGLGNIKGKRTVKFEYP